MCKRELRVRERVGRGAGGEEGEEESLGRHENRLAATSIAFHKPIQINWQRLETAWSR